MQRKELLIQFFLTAGSGHHFPLCSSGHSLWDCVSLLTSSLVLLRLYPQLTAMSIGCISVQPSSVQVFERLPGDGEEPKRSQPPKRYISSACHPLGSNWTRCDIVSDPTGHCKQQTTAKKPNSAKCHKKSFLLMWAAIDLYFTWACRKALCCYRYWLIRILPFI